MNQNANLKPKPGKAGRPADGLEFSDEISRRLSAAGGFTLVEGIVYVAVLAVLAAVVTASLISLSKTLSSLRSRRTLTQSEGMALDRMGRAIRSAASINAASSVLGSSPGVLVLADGADPSLTRRFYLFRETLVEDTGSGTATLTPPDVAVTKLTFYSANGARGVKIETTFERSDRNATTSQDLFLTAELRGAYQR